MRRHLIAAALMILVSAPLQAADVAANITAAIAAAERGGQDRERDARDRPLYYVDEKDGWPGIDASGFLDQLRAALKPGGRLLIVDHAAAAGSGNAPAQALHRIDEAFAKKDIASHGFELEKTWDGYRNPGDDLTKLVFDPAVRGKTDRFTHLYRKR